MRIISYDNAKVTVLFPFEEVVPLNGADVPFIISHVAERYNFTKVPQLNLPREEQDKSGLKFEIGRMQVGDKTIVIGDFTIYNDGIVITSKNTEEGEWFWADVMSWMVNTHKFRELSSTPPIRFISQLVIEFDAPLAKLIKAFASISNSISESLSEIYKTRIPLDFSRIDLEFDKLGEQSSLLVPKFVIERRQGIPFARERYYCSAPLRTADHIRILSTIEIELT